MKKLFAILALSIGLVFHAPAQTSNLVLQPGINVLATNAADFPTVTATNSGGDIVLEGYDTSDLTQFHLVTNTVDIVPIGSDFPPPRIVANIKPRLIKTVPSQAIARMQPFHWTNGCVVVLRGTNSLPTSIPIQ